MVSRSDPLKLLHMVSNELNSSLDLDEVLGKIMSLVVEVTGANRGSLFILREDGRVMRSILARGPNQSAEISNYNVQKVMNEGLAGWAYRHQKGVVVADTSMDDRWIHLKNETEITKSAMAMPLVFKKRVNGVIILHQESPGYFKNSHLSIAHEIAVQAAIAVENARLFTEVDNEREAFHSFLNSMPIPVIVVSRDCVVFRNRMAAEKLQIVEEKCELRSFPGGVILYNVLQKEDRESVGNAEVVWPDKRVFNVSISKAMHHGSVIALNDITYLKELDSMKSKFVETVSHDLKNPLHFIKTFSRLLRSENGLSRQAKTYVEDILSSTERMQELIESLLDLAAIEAGLGGKVEACDIAEIVKDVLVRIEPQISSKAITVVTRFQEDLGHVIGNEIRLFQVISNLVDNAIKYSDEGGKVIVDVNQTESEIIVNVSDEGHGISPTDQAQLFQKFYRAKGNDPEMPGGTGLGLSIVKAIIDSYGGRVWVESKLEKGSTFSFAISTAHHEKHTAALEQQ